MTIDEAIFHYYLISKERENEAKLMLSKNAQDECYSEAADAGQIAAWLMELQRLREAIKEIKQAVNECKNRLNDNYNR